ncbi:MAG TPA: ribonuclease HII [Thermoplasmata archaeon]|nr:ribonuclease HII [Thermoplasmata archaeon]
MAPPRAGSDDPGGPASGVLGIDEAGRGSLIGPLVVGGFLCPRGALDRLRELGARDSKQLSPERREEAYRALSRAGRAFSISLSPSVIDRYVSKGRLNRLEAEAFARIIRSARPEEAFVDACDPNAERFGEVVGRLCGRGTVVRSSHRADLLVPVVGAASIVAKVRRDRAIAALGRSLGLAVGSGYPSDPRTLHFVRGALGAGRPAPRWLRASWSTTGRLIRERQLRPLERYGP